MKGIYSITNIKNGRVYIGQSKDIMKRWKDHRNMLAAGNHHTTYDTAKTIKITSLLGEVL